MNILGFTRVDEQIVFFEHRLSDGGGRNGLESLDIQVFEISTTVKFLDAASPWNVPVMVWNSIVIEGVGTVDVDSQDGIGEDQE